MRKHDLFYRLLPVKSCVLISILLAGCQQKQENGDAVNSDKKDYLVAAYYWPAHHYEPVMNEFYPGEIGEWATIKASKPKFKGHNQPRYPLWGYQMEDETKVMEQKIDAAHKYGVDIFVWDWYWYNEGPYLENAINKGLLRAKNVDKIKFYIMWANHDATTVWDVSRSHDRQVVWPGTLDRKQFEVVVARIIRQYFSHPSYFKIDGKPVFDIYLLTNLVDGLGGVENTTDALNYFREEVKKAGFPGLHLQLTVMHGLMLNITGVDSQSSVVIRPEDIKKMGFNSITHYSWIHQSGVKDKNYVDWGMEATSKWPEYGQTLDLPYFPHVSIGWDNNCRFKELTDLVNNPTPESFKTFLMKAKAYVDQHPNQPPIITINSWNEWSEGGYLEPDMVNGYRYLEAIQEVLK